MKEFKLSKKEEEVTFRFLRWNDGWDFDCPTWMVKPIFMLNDQSPASEQFLEDVCIELSSEITLHDESEDLTPNWRKRFKQIVTDRLKGKKTWDKYEAIVSEYVVKFVWNEEEEWYDFEIISSIEK